MSLAITEDDDIARLVYRDGARKHLLDASAPGHLRPTGSGVVPSGFEMESKQLDAGVRWLAAVDDRGELGRA